MQDSLNIQFAGLWWLFPVIAGISFALTGLFWRYALESNLLDIPNERSSHVIPTPSGAGVVCMTLFFIALAAFWDLNIVSESLAFALLGSVACTVLIGFIDDYTHVSLIWRLLTHFFSAAWAVFWLGGLPPLPFFGLSIDFSWLGYLLCAIYLVWMLNLFNFMDGIDGIASIETITVCIGGIILYALLRIDDYDWVVVALLISVTVGFVIWNFPKARVFLGDVGSGSIGITLGIVSVQTAWVSPELFWSWVILLGAFIVDSTVTLLRRVHLGEKIYIAHCNHAYQYAARKFGSHPPVSLTFGAINLFWLLPIAALVAIGSLDGVMGVMVAYIPLVWLALRFKAGSRKFQEV